MDNQKSETNLSREKILDAALAAWSKDYFGKTSLAAVSRALGVTKPAIYRYFKNKEELLVSLEENFAVRYSADVLEPLEMDLRCRGEGTAPATSLPNLADAFIRKVGTFFRDNPNLYAFLVGSIFHRAVEYRESFQNMAARHAGLFHAAATEAVPDRSRRDQVIRFVGAFAVFWTTQCFRRPAPSAAHARRFDPSVLKDNPAAIEADMDRAARICRRGFLTGIGADQVDYHTVERVGWFQPEEMPEPDRILTAIEEVVSESGFENASVERIAERVGMTKSSLYFHFKNRDEMLSKMVLREQENFVRIAQTRLAALTNPVDRLYALMVMIAGYNYHNPIQLTVLNWLRYNHVEVQIPRNHVVKTLKMFRFLPQMVEEGSLAGDPQDPYPMLAFLNFIVQRELMSVPVKPLKPEDHIRRIRFLFQLFAFGIERLGQESL